MTDVLVVGAGPTGLALACLLRSHGVDVRVLDRLAAPASLARAMVLWSRSLEILADLKVADAALAAGIALERARYLDGDRLLASVRTNRVPGTRWQPLVLPQHLLERLLRGRLEALGGRVEWGAEVTAVAGAHGDAVTATVVHTDRSVEHASARYAVGCDGLRSAVRTAAGIGWRDHAPYEEVFLLGDVVAQSPLDRTAVSHFLGRSGVSVAIPMPDDLWRIVGYLDGEEHDRAPDADALRRLLAKTGHADTKISDVRWSGSFRVVRRLADDFREGRLLLAGDAAHVHSPAGGQGLNTGLQDANNLAWKLSLVVRGLADDALLDTYTRERRPIAARILRMTELQDTRLFGARSRTSRAVRNGVLRIASRSGALERGLIPDLAQVRVRYRDSPLTIAGDHRRGRALLPGRQAPDTEFAAADGSGPVALRDGSECGAITIVAMPGRGAGTDLPELRTLVRRYPGALRLRELTSEADGRRAGSGWLLALRPDGYIGYRGPHAVTPALSAWVQTALVQPRRTSQYARSSSSSMADTEGGL